LFRQLLEPADAFRGFRLQPRDWSETGSSGGWAGRGFFAVILLTHRSAADFGLERTVEVRAVGTEFSVAQAAGVTAVYVTEGRIAVTPVGTTLESAPAAPSPICAVAGERVLVPAAGPAGAQPSVTRLSDSEMASALAWRGERLELSEVPLAEAVRMINRRRTVPIVLADADLGRRTVTGVLWADDGDGFVRLLEQGFDLSAERDGKVVRLRARRER
jgi:transmembrane sensor